MGKWPSISKVTGNELRRWNVLWHSKKCEVDYADMKTHLPDNLLLALGACKRIRSQIFIVS